MSHKVYILDAAAVIHGLDAGGLNGEALIAPKAIDEVESRREILELLINIGKIKVVSPSSRHVQRISEVAELTGDSKKLTQADVDALALALEQVDKGKDVVLITDDYAVQNVASKLGIGYRPIIMKGIEYQISWLTYCPACGRTFSGKSRLSRCTLCGHELKRKPIRKRKIKS